MEVAISGYVPTPRSGEVNIRYFNLFAVANDYNFGARWPKGRGRRFFLATNKTFEGICLALAGKFLQKESWIIFVFKKIIKFSFKHIYEQVN